MITVHVLNPVVVRRLRERGHGYDGPMVRAGESLTTAVERCESNTEAAIKSTMDVVGTSRPGGRVLPAKVRA